VSIVRRLLIVQRIVSASIRRSYLIIVLVVLLVVVVRLPLLGALCLLLLPHASQSSWVLDSGASFHVTSDSSQLVDCKTVHDGASVQTTDDTSCSITHQGSLSNAHFTVPNVSLVPQLSINLLSVGQITDQNCFIGFDYSSCFVQDRRSGIVIGTGHRCRGSSKLYILDTLCLPSSSARVSSVSSSFLSSFMKYHHRLSHLWVSFVHINTSGYLGHTFIESNFHCKGCNLGK